MKNSVIIKTQFEGFHQFLNAPRKVSYLRELHRHVFYVELEIEVFHDDRELEFIMVKQAVDQFLKNTTFESTMSCEMYARRICEFIASVYGERKMTCTVLEDNENGGRVRVGEWI